MLPLDMGTARWSEVVIGARWHGGGQGGDKLVSRDMSDTGGASLTRWLTGPAASDCPWPLSKACVQLDEPVRVIRDR
jgi:hypothetical protein